MMTSTKKIYRVVLRGTRKGEGFFMAVVRRTPESIRKMTEKVYNVPVEVIPEPEMNEADACELNAKVLRLEFNLI